MKKDLPPFETLSPEKGHYEKVMVKDQWTEYKLVKEALYENKWIVDKEAWTEHKLVRYECIYCGEVEEATDSIENE